MLEKNNATLGVHCFGRFTSNEYVGSGGKNASLAAILEGQGGQQKRQQISLKLRPILFILFQNKRTKYFSFGCFLFSPWKIYLKIKEVFYSLTIFLKTQHKHSTL